MPPSMRYVLVADVHANLEALTAVLEHAAAFPDARLVCAGDVVGYGPDPEACIDVLAGRDVACVAGNHEDMVLGRLGFDRCVHSGIRAALWTRRVLPAAAGAWLAALPRRLELPGGLVVTHTSLDDPEAYVSSSGRADALLEQVARVAPGARGVVTGHTHHARLYQPGSGWDAPAVGRDLALDGSRGFVLNPGAVGQSRDGRPLARYALYDVGRDVARFFELSYDHHRTEAKLRRVGLVPRVSYTPPVGVARRVDDLRTRWARLRARSAS